MSVRAPCEPWMDLGTGPRSALPPAAPLRWGILMLEDTVHLCFGVLECGAFVRRHGLGRDGERQLAFLTLPSGGPYVPAWSLGTPLFPLGLPGGCWGAGGGSSLLLSGTAAPAPAPALLSPKAMGTQRASPQTLHPWF